MNRHQKTIIILILSSLMTVGVLLFLQVNKIQRSQDTINKQWIEVFVKHGLKIKLPPGTIVQKYHLDLDAPDPYLNVQLLVHEKLLPMLEASLPFDSEPSQSKYYFNYTTEQNFWKGQYAPKTFRFYEQGPVKSESLRMLIDLGDPKQPVIYIEWFAM